MIQNQGVERSPSGQERRGGVKAGCARCLTHQGDKGCSVCREIRIAKKPWREGQRAFAATWMDLEIIRLSEVSQKEKEKYHMISLICGI